MKQQNDLFPETLKARDSRGRFCTLERATYERASNENKNLRQLVEKYKRAFLVVSRENSRLHRELSAVKCMIQKQ